MNWFRSIPMQKQMKNPLRMMCTNHKKNDLPKSLNIAKLVGTVSTDVYTASISKDIIFFLRTFNQDQFYDVHKIIAPAYMTENLAEIPKTGQKLFVAGRPRTTNFSQDVNGKNGTSIQIVAKQIYLCDSNEIENRETENESNNVQFDIKDQNKIELFAQIPFEILNEERYCSFILALHHLARHSDGNEEKQTDFLPVFVYDDALRNLIRNNFKRLDRVRVEGALKYKTCVDNTGKKKYKGYIEASKIAKLTTLHQDPK